MTRQAAPRRQLGRKSDRITWGTMPPRDIRCDYAAGPFHDAYHRMEDKWGIDRLPDLVSPATAEKYGRALVALNEAMDANDPDAAKQHAANMIRALGVMDLEAEALGHKPADPEIWEYDLDGFKFAIIRDDREWHKLKKERPELLYFTMREVALALKEWKFDSPVIAEIKNHFPNAKVSKVERRAEFVEDDPTNPEFWV